MKSRCVTVFFFLHFLFDDGFLFERVQMGSQKRVTGDPAAFKSRFLSPSYSIEILRGPKTPNATWDPTGTEDTP